jgi:hypothetical protein
VGLKRNIQADNIISSGNDIYSFSSWSNGGAANQVILTPKTNTVYTSAYSLSETDTLTVVADAYVRGGTNAATTFGVTDATQLQTKTEVDAEHVRYAYLRFDISQAATVSGAKLRLLGKRNNLENSNIKVAVYGVNNATWNENTLTWNNKPAADTVILDLVEVNALPTSTGEYYEWNVSDYVKAAKVSNATSVSFLLSNPDLTSSYVFFNAKEAATGRPELVLTAPIPVTEVEETLVAPVSTMVFPNPFAESFSVQHLGDFSYSLYNHLGQQIESGKAQDHLLLGSNLKKGSYLLRLNSRSGDKSIRMYKQ